MAIHPWWKRNRKVNTLFFNTNQNLVIRFIETCYIYPLHTKLYQILNVFIYLQKVDKYMKNAKDLITSQDPNDIVSALSLLNSTLSISPHHELALELKARSLLYLRRFEDVAVLLHDYIPSLRIDNEDVSSVVVASSELSSLRPLLPSGSPSHDSSFKCFS